MPDTVLTKEQEQRYVQAAITDITREFSCDVIVVEAAESKEAKANQARPGKPALVVK